MKSNCFASAFGLRPSDFPWAALGLAALAAGCSMFKPAQNETRYYLLTPASSGTATSHTNTATRVCAIRVRPVELADYLQTKDIAVRTGPNQMKFALFHRWAEPLDAGIRRVLVEDLRFSPLVRQALTDEPAPERLPVYTLSMRVLACEGVSTNQSGSTAFEAAWELTGPGPNGVVLDHGVFRAPPATWPVGDYAQLAAQLSQSVADFTQAVLTALAHHPAD